MANEIIIEKSYKASAVQVWKAITDKDQMKKWYFELKEFKPEVGFVFEFIAGGTKDKEYLHRCEVTEVIMGKKLTYSWSYPGYEGKSFVTFELFEEGGMTKVKLTHTGIETFPESNPDFNPNNFKAGWGHIIGTALKDFVEK